MYIIQKQPNLIGGYSFIQNCSSLPKNCYEIICDMSVFYEYNGFVNLIIKDERVIGFTPNLEAYNAYESTQFNDIEQSKQNVLNRINGKCSTAIYSGITVNNKHYKLTPTAQSNLKTALDKIASGATSVIYSADNEEPTLHTAEQITAINNAAYEWGIVNTTYYGKLQKWIARETDITILNSIDYGVQLPNDLMQELNDLLQSVGTNISNYADKLINV